MHVNHNTSRKAFYNRFLVWHSEANIDNIIADSFSNTYGKRWTRRYTNHFTTWMQETATSQTLSLFSVEGVKQSHKA